MIQTDHHGQLQSSIVKALLYSDIFSYPLTAEEVFRRLPTNHTCLEEVTHELIEMTRKGIVFRFGDFFAIRNEQNLETRRRAGNDRACTVMPAALKRGRFLGKFPFIRSVMISGSLSKNYMDNDSDVDYFVITAPGRLWIARFLIAAFKRVFLFNSHKRFCVNYYIDDEHLEIEEKNIFTATELVTLVPVSGSAGYSKLINNNSWVRKFFPNVSSTDRGQTLASPSSWVKRLIETTLDPIGDALDKYILDLALNRYRKMYGQHFSPEDFNIAFKSRRDVSKNHDRHFQKHITELFDQKVEKFHRENREFSVG